MRIFIAYLKATYIRFNTRSTAYWESLQRFFTWLALVTASASEIGQTLIVQITGYGLNVPEGFKIIAGHIATAAFLARLVSQLSIDRNVVNLHQYEKLSDPAKTVEPATRTKTTVP